MAQKSEFNRRAFLKGELWTPIKGEGTLSCQKWRVEWTPKMRHE